MSRDLPLFQPTHPIADLEDWTATALERLDGRLVLLSLSGGKDSTAMALLLNEAGIPYRAIHMDTGWEHPDRAGLAQEQRPHPAPGPGICQQDPVRPARAGPGRPAQPNLHFMAVRGGETVKSLSQRVLELLDHPAWPGPGEDACTCDSCQQTLEEIEFMCTRCRSAAETWTLKDPHGALACGVCDPRAGQSGTSPDPWALVRHVRQICAQERRLEATRFLSLRRDPGRGQVTYRPWEITTSMAKVSLQRLMRALVVHKGYVTDQYTLPGPPEHMDRTVSLFLMVQLPENSLVAFCADAKPQEVRCPPRVQVGQTNWNCPECEKRCPPGHHGGSEWVALIEHGIEGVRT